MDNIDDMLKSIDDALGNKNPDQPKDLKQTLLDQIDSAIGVKPEAKKEEVVTSTQPTAQPIAPPISQSAALPSPIPQATPVAEKKSTTAYPSAVPSPVPQPTPPKEKELDLSKPSNQIFSIVGNKKEEEFNPTDFELLNTLTTGKDLYEFKKLRPDISLNSLQQEKIFEYLRESTPWKIPEKGEDWFNLGKASLELVGKDLPVMVSDIAGSFLKGGAKAIKQGVPFVLGQTSDYAEALEAEKLLSPEKRQEVEQWRQNAWRIANTPLKGGEKPNPNSYTDALYLEKVRAGLAPEQVAALNQKYEQKRAEAKQVPFEVTSELASLPESLAFMEAKVSEGGIQLWDTISEQAGLIDKEKAFERFMAREAVDTAKAKMQTNEPRAYARVVDTYFKPTVTAIQSSYIPGFSAYTSLFHPSIEEYMITYPELTREEAKAKRQNEIENNVLNYLEDVKKTIPETDPDLQMLGSLAMPGQFGLDTFGYAVNVVEAAKALTPLAKSRFRKMLYTDDQINAIEAMAQRALKERELKKLEKKQTPGIIEKTAGSTAKGIEATGEFIEKSPTFQKISNIAPYVTGAALGYQFDPENPLRGMVAGGLGGATLKFGLEKGAKALKETPKVIKEIQAARRISAGGEIGPLATLESIAKQQDEVKKLTAELKNLSEGTQEYIDTKKLLDEAKEKAKGIKAGGTEVVDYEGIGKVSDTTKNILKFVSDDIVSNVGEYAKLLVEPTLLGLATGIIDSSDEEELKAMIGQGLVFSIGGRALQQGYHQFIGEDPVVAARKARQVDVDALKTYRDSTPETREEINKLTDWNNVLERQSNKIDEATSELQGLQNDRAAMVEKNKNDPNFWNTDEFKNIDDKIKKLEKVVTSEQKSLSLLKTANVQTRNEFGRNFLHQLARNNMRLNGSLRSGQNNVGFNILSTQQIFDHFRNNPSYRDFSDADIMTAASQQGFYSGIGGSEFNPGASVTDSTKGLVFDPNKPSIVINSDSLRNRMMLFGETPTEALNHETGHHILKIKEIQDAVADARNILFTNEIRDASGNVKEISNGLYTSDDLNKMFSKNYLKNRSKEEIAQISQSIGLWDYNTNSLNPELVKNYMQEEILADMFANTLSRNVAKDLNDKRTHLFDVANLKMKNGLLKSAVTKMLGYGLSSDVVSEATNANISPEAQSAARNAMRLLESMNGDFTSIASLPQTTPISKAEIKKSKIAAERYGMDSGLFETKTVAQVFDENGKPIGTPIDVTDPAAFEGSWRIKSDGEERLSGYGQIPVSLRQLQVPNGGTLSISKRIVTEADGETPKLLKPEKLEKLQKDRASLFKQAIDTPDYGTPGRFEAVSEGSETYRGSFTPMQVKAIQDLPEGIVPLKIKKYLLDLNDAIVKKDGTRFYMDYAAVMDDKGNYKAFSPKIYDVVPIGLQLSTKGNFLVTTISVGRLMEKLNLWGDRMPNRLDPWSGSKTAFWNDFSTKYLDNWTKGIEGSGYNKQGEAIGNTLDSDVQKAEIKKDILNDFLNLATNDTRDFNLDRTTIPRRKGDPKNKILDRTIGSMRIDHIAELLNAEYLTKLPIDYGKAKINFMPERMEGEVPKQEKRQIDENVKFANPPSEKSAIDALSSNKREYFGMHRGLDDGYPVGIRIDIPAFTSKGVYVVTVHEKKKGGERGQVGERIGYDTIAKVDNPIFFSNEVGAKKIKSGEANKFPVATVEGQFNSSREIPEDINEWTPVGYNPREHSYFYDKTNDEPVLSGDEAISVGNTVFVKNPVYGDKANFAFMPERMEGEVPNQETLDAMKARLPKYKTQIIDSSEKNENRFKINIRNDKNEIVGFVTGNIDPVEKRTNIEQTVVYPDFQKQGYGEALYREIAKYSQSKGIDAIFGEEVSDKAEKVRKKLFPTTLERNGVEGENAMESQIDQNIRFMPENFDAIKNADKSLLPLNEQPENQSISGRLTSRQKIAIDELEQYYKNKTPERIQKLKKDAEESLANRLVNIGIPVSDSKKIASKSFSDIKKMSSGAMQVISGMGMSDLSRMAGTGRPSVETRKGINPSWLTSAFESFETDDALALMKAQQVARQLTKSDQAKVAAGEKVESAKASGVRESTKEQGMSFVIGEKTADQKAFGSSLREDTDAPPRVYASVVEGQKFGSQGNYNLFFEWDKNTPMVITSHHHYGVGNGLTDIHASANIGDKNARSFGDVENEKYDTLPSGKKVLDTYLLVGNDGASDIRTHQLMVSIPSSGIDNVKRAFKSNGVEGAKSEIDKIIATQLVGQPSQGKTQTFTSSEGVPPYVAVQKNRTEAYVLNPDLSNVKKITIASNSQKEIDVIKKNLVKAFENNGSKLPPISVVSKDSEASKNPGRKTITDKFFNATGKIAFMPEQPTEYEPISARIRPLQGISAPTKMVGAKAPVLGEIEPPVRSKAMLPDMELKPDISEKGIQSSDIITSAKPAPDAVIKPYSNALVSSAGLINFLPAYHGTPHEIPIEEGFKMSKVGTGEGAQAYGHGLYFAQARKVGEEYAKLLANRDLTGYKNAQLNAKDIVSRLGGNVDYAAEILRDQLKSIPENSLNFTRISDTLKIIETGEYAKDLEAQGNLYKVDIDVKDEDLLDWDGNNLRDTDDLGSGKINDSISKKILGWESIKSIEDFEQKLKEAETEFAYGGETGFYNLAMDDARQNNLPDVVDYWAGAYVNGSATGERIYNYLAATTSPKAASEYLNSIGIPGIRYLDGTSRKQGEGTYNYVIFDENLIKILDKNDKPVEGDLPKQAPLSGLQFMPAESKITRVENIPNTRILNKSIKTVNGSRYYNIVKDGEWYSIRISDHRQRSSQYLVTESIGMPRMAKLANIGMDRPHDINIVIDEPIKTESQAAEIINKVLNELPKKSIYRLESKDKNGNTLVLGNETIFIDGRFDRWEISYEDQDGKSFDEVKLITAPEAQGQLQFMPAEGEEKITETAVINKDGNIISSPKKNHAMIMEETDYNLDAGEFPPMENFGFLTNTGRFVTQKEAQDIAKKSNQVVGNQQISGEIVSAQNASIAFLPESIDSSTSVKTLTDNENYNEAKYNGNPMFGYNIAKKYLTQDIIDSVNSKIDPEKPAVIIPVSAFEGEDMNTIPLAVADALSWKLNIPVSTDIVKSSSAHNTGATAEARSRTIHNWDGKKPAEGTQIILVDDTYTTGQTLKSLANYVGEPTAIVTLASSRYGKQFDLSAERENKMLAKAGITRDEFISLYGKQPNEKLTGAQAQQYILNGKAGKEGLLTRFPSENSQTEIRPDKEVSNGSGKRRVNPDEYIGLNFTTKDKDNTYAKQMEFAFPKGPKTLTYFSGIGTWEQGLKGEIDPQYAVEYDPAKAAAYRAANGDHMIEGDVTQIDPQQFKGIEYFHASPVCKNYSILKDPTRGGEENDLDIRSADAVNKVLKTCKPKFFTLENVGGYRKSDAYESIKNTLLDLGYKFDDAIYNANEYGSPTDRKRLLLRATLGDDLPAPIKQQGGNWYDTVADIINDLPDAPIKGANFIWRELNKVGIDPENVPYPILIAGGGSFKQVPWRSPDEPAYTFTTNQNNVDRILLPGGISKRVTGRAKARMSGFDDSLVLPENDKLANIVIGNGVPPDLVKNVIGPMFTETTNKKEK